MTLWTRVTRKVIQMNAVNISFNAQRIPDAGKRRESIEAAVKGKLLRFRARAP